MSDEAGIDPTVADDAFAGEHSPEVLRRPPLDRQILGYAGYMQQMLDLLARGPLAPLLLDADGPGAAGTGGEFVRGLTSAWASVADVVSFYTGQLANVAYLGTADTPTARTELMASVGQQPRPPVASQVALVFDVAPPESWVGTLPVPAGVGVLSVVPPGADTSQPPHMFTTLVGVETRAEWNRIGLQRPPPRPIRISLAGSAHTLTLASRSAPVRAGDTLVLDGARSLIACAVTAVGATAIEARRAGLADLGGAAREASTGDTSDGDGLPVEVRPISDAVTLDLASPTLYRFQKSTPLLGNAAAPWQQLDTDTRRRDAWIRGGAQLVALPAPGDMSALGDVVRAARHPVNRGLPTVDVRTLRVLDGGVVLVGTGGKGVYRATMDALAAAPISREAGSEADEPWAGVPQSVPALWVAASQGLDRLDIAHIGPEMDGVVLAGGVTGGIFRSSDRGQTWAPIGLGATVVMPFTVDGDKQQVPFQLSVPGVTVTGSTIGRVVGGAMQAELAPAGGAPSAPPESAGTDPGTGDGDGGAGDAGDGGTGDPQPAPAPAPSGGAPAESVGESALHKAIDTGADLAAGALGLTGVVGTLLSPLVRGAAEAVGSAVVGGVESLVGGAKSSAGAGAGAAATPAAPAAPAAPEPVQLDPAAIAKGVDVLAGARQALITLRQALVQRVRLDLRTVGAADTSPLAPPPPTLTDLLADALCAFAQSLDDGRAPEPAAIDDLAAQVGLYDDAVHTVVERSLELYAVGRAEANILQQAGIDTGTLFSGGQAALDRDTARADIVDLFSAVLGNAGIARVIRAGDRCARAAGAAALRSAATPAADPADAQIQTRAERAAQASIDTLEARVDASRDLLVQLVGVARRQPWLVAALSPWDVETGGAPPAPDPPSAPDTAPAAPEGDDPRIDQERRWAGLSLMVLGNEAVAAVDASAAAVEALADAVPDGQSALSTPPSQLADGVTAAQREVIEKSAPLVEQLWGIDQPGPDVLAQLDRRTLSVGGTIIPISGPQVSLAATERGLYQSLDGGASWRVYAHPQAGTDAVRAVALDVYRATIYAATANGLFSTVARTSRPDDGQEPPYGTKPWLPIATQWTQVAVGDVTGLALSQAMIDGQIYTVLVAGLRHGGLLVQSSMGLAGGAPQSTWIRKLGGETGFRVDAVTTWSPKQWQTEARFTRPPIVISTTAADGAAGLWLLPPGESTPDGGQTDDLAPRPIRPDPPLSGDGPIGALALDLKGRLVIDQPLAGFEPDDWPHMAPVPGELYLASVIDEVVAGARIALTAAPAGETGAGATASLAATVQAAEAVSVQRFGRQTRCTRITIDPTLDLTPFDPRVTTAHVVSVMEALARSKPDASTDLLSSDGADGDAAAAGGSGGSGGSSPSDGGSSGAASGGGSSPSGGARASSDDIARAALGIAGGASGPVLQLAGPIPPMTAGRPLVLTGRAMRATVSPRAPLTALDADTGGYTPVDKAPDTLFVVAHTRLAPPPAARPPSIAPTPAPGTWWASVDPARAASLLFDALSRGPASAPAPATASPYVVDPDPGAAAGLFPGARPRSVPFAAHGVVDRAAYRVLAPRGRAGAPERLSVVLDRLLLAVSEARIGQPGGDAADPRYGAFQLDAAAWKALPAAIALDPTRATPDDELTAPTAYYATAWLATLDAVAVAARRDPKTAPPGEGPWPATAADFATAGVGLAYLVPAAFDDWIATGRRWGFGRAWALLTDDGRAWIEEALSGFEDGLDDPLAWPATLDGTPSPAPAAGPPISSEPPRRAPSEAGAGRDALQLVAWRALAGRQSGQPIPMTRPDGTDRSAPTDIFVATVDAVARMTSGWTLAAEQRVDGVMRWGIFGLTVQRWVELPDASTAAPWLATWLEELRHPIWAMADVWLDAMAAGGQGLDGARAVALWMIEPALARRFVAEIPRYGDAVSGWQAFTLGQDRRTWVDRVVVPLIDAEAGAALAAGDPLVAPALPPSADRDDLPAARPATPAPAPAATPATSTPQTAPAPETTPGTSTPQAAPAPETTSSPAATPQAAPAPTPDALLAEPPPPSAWAVETYPIDAAAPYGPAFGANHPPGLPQTARRTSRKRTSLNSVAEIARAAVTREPECFAATTADLSDTESGGMYGRPANNYDNRPQDQRPEGKGLITAWGAFQWNRDAWRSIGLTDFPWESTGATELAGPVKRYAELWVELFGRSTAMTPLYAARGVRLWHRSPAAYASYRDAMPQSSPAQAWAAVPDSHRSPVDGHLAKIDLSPGGTPWTTRLGIDPADYADVWRADQTLAGTAPTPAAGSGGGVVGGDPAGSPAPAPTSAPAPSTSTATAATTASGDPLAVDAGGRPVRIRPTWRAPLAARYRQGVAAGQPRDVIVEAMTHQIEQRLAMDADDLPAPDPGPVEWRFVDGQGRLYRLTTDRADDVALEHARTTDPTLAEAVAVADTDFTNGRTTAGREAWSSLPLAAPLARAYDITTVSVRGNVTVGGQGQTTPWRVLGSGDGSVANQAFPVDGLLYAPSADGPPAATLQVEVDGAPWTEVARLGDAGPDDRVYTLSHDAAGGTRAVFGDGARGARLPSGLDNVLARWQTGGGSTDPVAAGTLRLLVRPQLGVSRVDNPLPSARGEPPLTPEAARTAYAMSGSVGSVVTLEDYGDAVRAIDGIAKATVRLSGNTVTVVFATTDPDDAPDMVDGVYRTLQAQRPVAERRRVRMSILAATPRYFGVQGRLVLEPGQDAGAVRRAAEDALLSAMAFDARAIGQPVVAAAVIERVQQTDGVAGFVLERLELVSGSQQPLPPTTRARAPAALWVPGPDGRPDPRALLIVGGRQSLVLAVSG